MSVILIATAGKYELGGFIAEIDGGKIDFLTLFVSEIDKDNGKI